MKDIIINTQNPVLFLDSIKKYEKKLLKNKDYGNYIDEITDIIEKNKIGFHNDFLMSRIVKNIDFDHFEYPEKDDLFEKLKNRYYAEYKKRKETSFRPGRYESYWIVRLVSLLVRKDAYEFLIDVIKSDDATEIRSNAMKSLSMVSKQPFDRGLSKDTGHWAQTDIRIKELDAWIAEGCPDGSGYPPPVLDPALFNPTNDFERLVSRLNEKLKKEQDTSDYSSYDNFLIVPCEEKRTEIFEKYDIRGLYAEFLTRFSPCKAIVTKGAYEILLYGVHDITENQIGYSIDRDNHKLEGWRENYLVIADKFGDPYCIDITKQDSEIFYAKHGEGNWKFKKAYNSFLEFLEYLAK